MSDNHILSKQAAGRAAVDLIQDDMLIGLGTGSTAAEFIRQLAERCRTGLRIQAIATSKQSQVLAQSLNIPLLAENAVTQLDLTVDGADEIDHAKQIIKGGGGALLREKILATISREMVVIVDHTKVVQTLGAFPLAVEVLPFCCTATQKCLSDLRLKNKLRTKNGNLFMTDNGNYIADCDIKPFVQTLSDIDSQLHRIPGVLETGLFLGIAGRVIVGYPDGTTKML